MRTVYFRYVSAVEREFIDEQSCVESFSGMTWLSPDCLDNPAAAMARLSLPVKPDFRVGAIPEDWLPELVVDKRRAAPKFGQPGGGWEIAVRGRIYLCGIVRLK